MNQTKKFAFIAHYVEPWNWLLNFKMFGFLHKNPKLHVFLTPLFPIYWAMSFFYLIRRKPFQVVDSYIASEGLHGYTILINNFGWHFANGIVMRVLFKNRYALIRERILAATLFAQNELKVDVVGLGALTKDETLTQGGAWLAKQPNVNVPIVHGDTCTAWFVIKRIIDLGTVAMRNPIVLIGPSSKIGRAVMLYLASRGYSFAAYSESEERIAKIKKELPDACSANVVRIDSLERAALFDVWITGKCKPSGRRHSKLRSGALCSNRTD